MSSNLTFDKQIGIHQTIFHAQWRQILQFAQGRYHLMKPVLLNNGTVVHINDVILNMFRYCHSYTATLQNNYSNYAIYIQQNELNNNKTSLTSHITIENHYKAHDLELNLNNLYISSLYFEYKQFECNDKRPEMLWGSCDTNNICIRKHYACDAQILGLLLSVNNFKQEFVRLLDANELISEQMNLIGLRGNKIIINNKWKSITNESYNANILAIQRKLYFEDFIIDSNTVIVIYETGGPLKNSKQFVQNLLAMFSKYEKIYLITSYPKSINTIKYKSVSLLILVSN